MQILLKKITPNLIQTSKKYFPEEYLEKLRDKEDESIVARYLISKLVEENFGIKKFLPEINKEGIPVFNNNIFWSISHKKGIVFVGIAKEKFGLDLEIIKKRDNNLLSNFSDLEYNILNEKNWENFYLLWTAKESIIKYKLLNLDDMQNIFLTGIENDEMKIGGIKFNKKLKFGKNIVNLVVIKNYVLALTK